MAKLGSFHRECLALGFKAEVLSFKHLNSPSKALKLRNKEVSSTENMLATVGLGFGTENWEEVEGLSMWIGRGVSLWVEDRCNLLEVLRGGRPWRLFSSGVNSEGNGGGGRQEVYCSQDLFVGWKGLVMWTEKVVGWNAKPSPSHMELPVCSGVSLQVSWSLSARIDLGIKICCEGTQLPLWCTVNQISQPTILHCK